MLWVSLPAPGYRAEPRPDGYAMKVGWWRLAKGSLRITATRVAGQGDRRDIVEEAMTPEVPSGYGAVGFQPSGLIFSERGCWDVAAGLAGLTIRFRLRVT
ncbi:hypothetical protein [Sphaerisporangium rufum]|uniref:hypothetical protein n=1 Tax=Sphaerisporangium rufum TaxID=1381558 RepID=UPI0019514CE0|nr:hypothetical protein [Sphaerisporangium rufum]